MLLQKKTQQLLKVLENQLKSLARVNQIRAQLEETTSEFDREKLQERLS